jgi:hypothetical protein
MKLNIKLFLSLLLWALLPNLSYAQSIQIQQMVQQVSGDTLFFTMADLQQMDRVNASNSMVPADYLKQRLLDYGVDTVFYQYFLPNTPPNVVGVRFGTLPQAENWVIGAHYDAVRPGAGADDNASGTAAVLEMARVTKNHHLNHNLMLVLFAAEEVGLWGSYAFVDSALNHFPIAGMINLDMIAYSHQLRDSSVSVCYRYFCVDMLNEFISATSMYVPELQIETDSTSSVMYASDHAPFWQRYIPALFLIENSDRWGGSFNPYYHTFDDTIGTGANSPWLAEKITRSAIATLLTLVQPVPISIGDTPHQTDPLSLYPNPTTGHLIIRGVTESMQSISVKIFDHTGKLWMQEKLYHPHCTLNISSFPDGFYYVNVQYPKGVKTLKIIKKAESRK